MNDGCAIGWLGAGITRLFSCSNGAAIFDLIFSSNFSGARKETRCNSFRVCILNEWIDNVFQNNNSLGPLLAGNFQSIFQGSQEHFSADPFGHIPLEEPRFVLLIGNIAEQARVFVQKMAPS